MACPSDVSSLWRSSCFASSSSSSPMIWIFSIFHFLRIMSCHFFFSSFMPLVHFRVEKMVEAAFSIRANKIQYCWVWFEWTVWLAGNWQPVPAVSRSSDLHCHLPTLVLRTIIQIFIFDKLNCATTLLLQMAHTKIVMCWWFKIMLQRHLMGNELYKPGGPVFLMIGVNNTASKTWMSRSFAGTKHPGKWEPSASLGNTDFMDKPCQVLTFMRFFFFWYSPALKKMF